ncbi:MAG: hypothetical protein HKO94_00630, partial [Flavobacteriaceae bacterium]|nr:hypothetical protein [Flavobacteriaceae bacterium]
MRYIALIILLFLSLSSCKSSKTAIVTTKKEASKSENINSSVAEAVIQNARAYEGVRY